MTGSLMADDHIPLLAAREKPPQSDKFTGSRGLIWSADTQFIWESPLPTRRSGNKCKLDHSTARIVKQEIVPQSGLSINIKKKAFEFILSL
jgi:hypothetical protein